MRKSDWEVLFRITRSKTRLIHDDLFNNTGESDRVRNQTVSTLSRGLLRASILLITLVALSKAHAATLAGVGLPDEATVGGQDPNVEWPGSANRHPQLIPTADYVGSLDIQPNRNPGSCWFPIGNMAEKRFALGHAMAGSRRPPDTDVGASPAIRVTPTTHTAKR